MGLTIGDEHDKKKGRGTEKRFGGGDAELIKKSLARGMLGIAEASKFQADSLPIVEWTVCTVHMEGFVLLCVMMQWLQLSPCFGQRRLRIAATSDWSSS